MWGSRKNVVLGGTTNGLLLTGAQVRGEEEQELAR